MTHQKKIRVAVLYGGRSGEHEVSLLSAKNVIQYLDPDLFEVVPIGIDKQGAWYLGQNISQKELSASTSLQLHAQADRLLFNPDQIVKRTLAVSKELLPQFNASDKLFDVVFPAIHGIFCEDGTIQGLLELADVPYVGCNVLSSAVGMDKDVSKRLMVNAGVPVPLFTVIKHGQWQQNPAYFCELVMQQLGMPVFVKPANTGSSVGVSKVKNSADLMKAINEAFQYDLKVVVEKGLDVIELEVAVLESENPGEPPIVSKVGEVKPHHEFYSYAAKYLDENGAELMIPASVSPEIQEEARELAQRIFNVLDCEGMARVDLFLERGTNRLYFNEINTLPGFTQISMYPKLMAASGVSYSELLTRLIRLAMQRHEAKSKLHREYVANGAGSVVSP